MISKKSYERAPPQSLLWKGEGLCLWSTAYDARLFLGVLHVNFTEIFTSFLIHYRNGFLGGVAEMNTLENVGDTRISLLSSIWVSFLLPIEVSVFTEDCSVHYKKGNQKQKTQGIKGRKSSETLSSSIRTSCIALHHCTEERDAFTEPSSSLVRIAIIWKSHSVEKGGQSCPLTAEKSSLLKKQDTTRVRKRHLLGKVNDYPLHHHFPSESALYLLICIWSLHPDSSRDESEDGPSLKCNLLASPGVTSLM